MINVRPPINTPNICGLLSIDAARLAGGALCMQNEVGKGSFQELDQVAAVRPFCKFTVRATRASDIAAALRDAHKASMLPGYCILPGLAVH